MAQIERRPDGTYVLRFVKKPWRTVRVGFATWQDANRACGLLRKEFSRGFFR